MSIFNVLRGIMFGESEASKKKIELVRKDVIKDIDFYKAIQAHVMWKRRLQDYIDGVSSEELNHKEVCLDSKCALGKWIHGSGKVHLGSEPIFEDLKDKHALFHFEAGKVVELVQSGDKGAAQRVVDGDYNKVSNEVVHMITQLNKVFNGK